MSPPDQRVKPVKRKRSSEVNHDDPDFVKANISSIIGGIFGYDRHKYDDDYDDLDDMEAGIDDLRKEEARRYPIQ
jgi:hypothetical protein